VIQRLDLQHHALKAVCSVSSYTVCIAECHMQRQGVSITFLPSRMLFRTEIKADVAAVRVMLASYLFVERDLQAPVSDSLLCQVVIPRLTGAFTGSARWWENT